MIPSCQPWSRGSVPSAGAAWETKDPKADGESRAAAGPRPAALPPAALTPWPTPGEGEAGNRPACIFHISFRMKVGI